MAQWIIVAIAIAGLIFNSGILYNDIKHLKKEFAEMKQELQQKFAEMKQELQQIRIVLMEKDK